MSGALNIKLADQDDAQDIDAELGKLACLAAVRYGLPVHYASLLTARDEIARVAAMAALLEMGVLKPVHWDLAVEMSSFQAVRPRAFRFFMGREEYTIAAQVVERATVDTESLRTSRMLAELGRDVEACLRLDRELFLATGSVEHLYDAQRNAETIGGWRAALPWAVLSIIVQPVEPRGPSTLFRHLRSANQVDRVEALCGIFRNASIYPFETAIFGAFAATARGRPKDALKALNDVVPRVAGGLKSVALQIRAQAFEAIGQFAPAYNSYAQMNEVDLAPGAAGTDVIRHYRERAAYEFEPLPADERNRNHVMMLGFPRSGTTLLENALSAHPEVETFEEVPSFVRAADYLDRNAVPGRKFSLEPGLEARRRYYDEIQRRMVKPGARIFIDKLPMNSAAIKTLEKLLPGKRYIFSIRHPYDVVLSCFKQHFARNVAMDNFRRFPDACRLYDFAMSQWFDVFSLDERERVAYVRYEELINDFQATTTRVLRFVGAEWDDRVLDFAAKSEHRYARTPSYQKVRAGLSVGVQSTWRNFSFLFDSRDAEPLKRWVRHFGYEGL